MAGPAHPPQQLRTHQSHNTGNAVSQTRNAVNQKQAKLGARLHLWLAFVGYIHLQVGRIVCVHDAGVTLYHSYRLANSVPVPAS